MHVQLRICVSFLAVQFLLVFCILINFKRLLFVVLCPLSLACSSSLVCYDILHLLVVLGQWLCGTFEDGLWLVVEHVEIRKWGVMDQVYARIQEFPKIKITPNHLCWGWPSWSSFVGSKTNVTYPTMVVLVAGVELAFVNNMRSHVIVVISIIIHMPIVLFTYTILSFELQCSLATMRAILLGTYVLKSQNGPNH